MKIQYLSGIQYCLFMVQSSWYEFVGSYKPGRATFWFICSVGLILVLWSGTSLVIYEFCMVGDLG